MKNLPIAFICLFTLPILAVAQSLDVEDLRCEHLVDPMGIDIATPRLSWRLRSSERGVLQTAYQIRVAAEAADLARGRRLLWDSGRVSSDQSLYVPYGGPTPQARQRYYWQVRVWDNLGNVSPYSETVFWEMGLLSPDSWQAQWIAAPWEEDKTRSQPCPMFRAEFEVRGTVARARAYITAHGLYEAEINGGKVGDQLFTPGWTSFPNRLQYQTYDIAPLLRQGANAIGVTLGDGWYRGFIGWSTQRNFYGDELALLLRLEITYTNGRTQTVLSGPNWKADTGPIRHSDIYNGEAYDARLEKKGWSSPGYDDREWQAARTLDLPKNHLVAPLGVPVRHIETVEPVKIITTPKGELVFDFGQNLVGRLRLKARRAAGETITIHHAEVLDKDGNFYTANLRAAKQELQYTFKGEGLEEYEPRFSFMGFRYARVQGLAEPPTLELLSAQVIHSDMARVGEFECSDSLINQLQSNIRWGQKGNFLDVPTDCPQRDERMGWTGDAQAFGRTAAFNYDVAAFFRKWLHDLAADQREDGRVPFVIPNVLNPNAAASAGWADAAVIIPWDMYVAYADRALLEEQYESMKAWVDYMARAAGEDYLWNTGFHFGDWLFFSVNDDRDGRSAITDKYLIAQAFFAHSTDLLRRVAQTLGKSDDARRYGELLDKVKHAFLMEYVTPSGQLASSTQTAYVLALQFDLLPEALRPGVAQRLINNIQRYGHLTTGFLGTPYLCHVLSRFGHDSTAYRLLERREYPSWLYPVTQGATTIWERWDGQKPDGTFQSESMNSFNHYAYGAIGEWLYRRVAGINPVEDKPGYRHALIQPTPGGSLTHAQAAHRSPYGRLASAWRIEGQNLRLEIVLPPNTTAELRLPQARLEQVRESGAPLSEARGVAEPAQNGPFVTMRIGSGNYVFEYPLDR